MNTIRPLNPIIQPVNLPSPQFMRYSYLIKKEAKEGLTFNEATELVGLREGWLDDKIRQEELAEAYEGVPAPTLTPDEVDELARIEHSKRHGFPVPHEL